MNIEKNDNAQLLKITDSKQVHESLPIKNEVERSLSPSIVSIEATKVPLNRSKTVQVNVLPLMDDSEIGWNRATAKNSMNSTRSEPVLSSPYDNHNRGQSNKNIRAMTPIDEYEYEPYNRSSQLSNYSNRNLWYL